MSRSRAGGRRGVGPHGRRGLGRSDRLRVLGWDVGGANVKGALAGPGGVRAATRSHRLWEEPEALPALLAEMRSALAGSRPPDAVALTLTAELADVFASKAEGVAFVVGAAGRAARGAPLRVLSSSGAFLTAPEARRRPLAVASANWVASARLVARRFPDAILVDAGSTTTDIVPIAGGEVAAEGRTDLERLRLGELVYTGAVRTPVCAIARDVPLAGGRCRLAAERFAQSGDVHLLLGRLTPGRYGGPAPDGRARTRAAAAARLARMLCADPRQLGAREIRRVAAHLAARQEREIAVAIREVRRRLGPRAPKLAVTAGSGAFLARGAAARAGLDVRDLSRWLGGEGSRAAPAVAVALLLDEEGG